MSQLFCKVGDLAVTIEAEVPTNLGNIVRVVSAVGYKEFSSYKRIFLWNVEAASPDRPLVYEFADGRIEKCLSGRIPDRYLRPIKPDELEWVSEQENTLLIPNDESKEVDYV